MIQEAYVSFEVAKLLKKKGFDEPTLAFYIPFEDGEVKFRIGSVETYFNTLENYPWMVSAPTQQMACAWLRREKSIHMSIDTVISSNVNIYFNIDTYSKDSGWHHPVDFYDSYEDAVEAALKYSLENLL